MIRGLLRGLGLATLGELRVVEEKLRTLRQRLEQSDARLAQTAARADRFERARREDAMRHKARVAALEAGQQSRSARARESADRASRRIVALEQALGARGAELAAAAQQETQVEQRIATAMEDLQAVRTALAAVEVKLGILEGAANVLDHRTRAPRPHES